MSSPHPIVPARPRRRGSLGLLAGAVISACLGASASGLEVANRAPRPRIAFLDLDRAVSTVEAGRKRLDELDDWALAQQDEVATLVGEVGDAQSRLAAAEATQPPSEVQRLRTALAVARARFLQKQTSVRREVEARQKVIAQEIGDRIRKIVATWAAERAYTAVFLRSPDRHLFVSEHADITDEIVEIFNRDVARRTSPVIP